MTEFGVAVPEQAVRMRSSICESSDTGWTTPSAPGLHSVWVIEGIVDSRTRVMCGAFPRTGTTVLHMSLSKSLDIGALEHTSGVDDQRGFVECVGPDDRVVGLQQDHQIGVGDPGLEAVL